MESLEEKQHVGIKIFRPSRINLITRNERSRQVAPCYFANQQNTRHETKDKLLHLVAASKRKRRKKKKVGRAKRFDNAAWYKSASTDRDERDQRLSSPLLSPLSLIEVREKGTSPQISISFREKPWRVVARWDESTTTAKIRRHLRAVDSSTTARKKNK